MEEESKELIDPLKTEKKTVGCEVELPIKVTEDIELPIKVTEDIELPIKVTKHIEKNTFKVEPFLEVEAKEDVEDKEHITSVSDDHMHNVEFDPNDSKTNEEFKCDVCGKLQRDRWNLQRHKQRTHANTSVCKICDNIFITGHIFDNHKKVCCYQCEECDYSSSTASGLSKHKEKKHKQT